KHTAYPRVVLTDADGRPYALEWGYTLGQAEPYVARLEDHRRKRDDRDELLAAVGEADGAKTLPAAEAALRFLANEVEGPTLWDDGTYALGLEAFYAPELKQWRILADAHDPENAGGYRERFFRADWGRRCRRALADPGSDPAALRALAEEFDVWRSQSKFKDPARGADLRPPRGRLPARPAGHAGAVRGDRR